MLLRIVIPNVLFAIFLAIGAYLCAAPATAASRLLPAYKYIFDRDPAAVRVVGGGVLLFTVAQAISYNVALLLR